ncbi:MAG: zf-HC2 domain-containing protein [Thermoanaerobaculia bacterium]|nr:zf-HC2 domain-containing protein [Thermoanaerobaculia bacterium]
MSGHASVEQLSRYLDEELAARERSAVEVHLGDCASCRERLVGLRRVVGELERLQEQAPPRQLGALVRRRLQQKRPPGSLVARLEERVRRVPVTPPLLPLFGVLLALAIALYLLALAAARWESSGPGQQRPAPPSAETAPAEPPAAGWRRLAGRDFRRSGDVWLERGVGPQESAERVEWLSPDLAAELAELSDLDGPVRLRLHGRLVEIDPDRLAPAR